jgi:hypothetical protein
MSVGEKQVLRINYLLLYGVMLKLFITVKCYPTQIAYSMGGKGDLRFRLCRNTCFSDATLGDWALLPANKGDAALVPLGQRNNATISFNQKHAVVMVPISQRCHVIQLTSNEPQHYDVVSCLRRLFVWTPFYPFVSDSLVEVLVGNIDDPCSVVSAIYRVLKDIQCTSGREITISQQDATSFLDYFAKQISRVSDSNKTREVLHSLPTVLLNHLYIIITMNMHHTHG